MIPTTPAALRAAIAATIACSAQELQEAIGQVVVATVGELPQASSAEPEVRSLHDAATRTMVLLADRIPAGQEAQALAEEIERHHGRAAQAVLGDRVAELLGGDGKVQDDDSAFEAEMLKQQREHEEEMASEPQVAWQEQGWNSSDDGLSEFKKCVVRDPDGTFISSLMRSERGGEPVLESCGVPRSSLAAAKADVMARGNVDCEVVVHKLTDAVQTHQSAQVEPNTVLLGRNQAAMAERAFEAYNFGEGVAVAGVSGWEYYAAGHERSREVYVANVTNDGNENPSTRLGFTVRFDPQTGVLAEAYAEDATGAAFGCMPEGQLEKLNGRQAAETVLDERADELLGGDGKVSIYTDPNEFLLSEYSKYAEHIAEGDPMAFDDWLAGSDLPEIVKAREVAKVQERNLSNNTEHTELPPIKSNVSVRLVDGVVVNGVVTEHGQKDGKPTFDFDYYHRTHDGQTIKASKWAWPAMVVQRKPTNFIEQSQQPVSAVAARIAEALPANSGYEKGYKDALESIVLALAPKMAASLDEAVETALDAYSNNVDDPSPAGEQPVRAVSDATLLSEINRRGMLQPLYGAIGAMHDHLDRTGALDEHLTQYLTYRLRREEAAITGMPDSAARVANWQECIDQLDRETRAVKVEDSPSPGM